MQRDDLQDPNANPEDYLRQQIANQVGQGVPTAVPDPVTDPVYAPPPPTPAPPDPGQSASNQGITDPGVQSPSPPANPIPTNTNGSQVGGGTPWAPGASAPAGAPAGYTWDPNMASYEPSPGTPATGAQAPTPSGPSTSRPTNGLLTDPSFASQYVAWAGTQPGVNPSVRNDPGYWIGRFTSGAFGNDQNYALARMMQAEGAPEGAGAPATAPRVNGPSPTNYSAPQISAPGAGPSFSSLTGGSGPQGVWNSDFVAQLRQLLMSRLASASTPVDPNSATITAPLNAARDEATRASDKERTSLAENLYAQGGLNTDAIAQKVQQSGEKNAAGLSSLRATLITREMAQKQDELKSLLQMAIQSGDAESAQAIQLQLAALTAQVQREGIGADLAKYQAYLNALGSQQVMA